MAQPGASRADELLGSAIVRVCDEHGGTFGVGFLATSELVITCAHLLVGRHGGTGAEPVGLEFPLLARPDGSAVPTIEVRAHRVLPARDDDSGDTAVLWVRTPLPPGAAPLPLASHDGQWDDPVRIFGFPPSFDHGIWVAGRLRGRQGAGWTQVESQPGHPGVGAGFSGSPVWSDRLGAVIGMTVAAHTASGATTAYLVPADTLIDTHPELAPAAIGHRCPYRGLEPFLEEHADVFYGRTAAADTLANTLGTRSVVVVAGPSGSGKSSLVHAGLLPGLREAGTTIVRFRPDPGLAPEMMLAAVLVPVLEPGLGEVDRLAETRRLADQLSADDRETSTLVAGQLVDRCGDGGLLIFGDQFEEIVASDPDLARELFALLISLVEAASRPARKAARLRAVLTLRSASLDELVTGDTADVLNHGTMLLSPMSREQLRASVTGPMPATAFEPGLVERLLDDAGGGHGRLPLVQFALTRLWEDSSGGSLTHASYERLGGVSGALASYAENIYLKRLTPLEQAGARRLFGELTRPEEDGGFSLRPARVGELDPDLLPVLSRLAVHRLVVIGHAPDGAEIVDVVHQALIQRWDRLRGWLVEDREFRAWQQQVRQAASRWEELDRDQGSLLRGSALMRAQEWLAARRSDSSPIEQRYIQASASRRHREARIWQLITAVIGVLVLGVGGLAVTALRANVEQQRQLRTQASELVSQESLRQSQAGDQAAALQLALAAWHTDNGTAGAYEALLAQELVLGSTTEIYPDSWTGELTDWETTPDGSVIAAVVTDPDGATRLMAWSGVRDSLPEPWQVPDTDRVIAAALSPDGSRLAAADIDGSVRVWNLNSRAEPVILHTGVPVGLDSLLRDDPMSLEFSPDGRRLLRGYEPLRGVGRDSQVVGSLAVWDIDDPEPVRIEQLELPRLSPGSISFGRDADTLIVHERPFDGAESVTVEDALSGRTLRELPTGDGAAIAFHGGSVVVCDHDSDRDSATLRVLDVDGGTDRSGIPVQRCHDSTGVPVDSTGRYWIDDSAGEHILRESYRYEVLVLIDLSDGQRYRPATGAWPASRAVA